MLRILYYLGCSILNFTNAYTNTPNELSTTDAHGEYLLFGSLRESSAADAVGKRARPELSKELLYSFESLSLSLSLALSCLSPSI